MPVTSGPVPPVSAPPGPSRLGSQDCVTPSSGNYDDLPPPPPPAEPYKDFLTRVGHDQSDSARPTTQHTAVTRPYASVTTTTSGTRLPTPFPTSSWMLPNLVPASGIRMPLPASFYAAPPSPWVWPGQGPAVTAPAVRAFQPAPPPAGLAGLLGPSGRFPGPFQGGPAPAPPTAFSLPDSEKCSSTPCAFEEFFRVPRPPFVQQPGNPVPPSAPGLASVAPTVTQPDAVNPSQGPSLAMIKSWKEDFMREIKSCWTQFLGEAPPQPTVGPSVPVVNMGPDALRQLSPSDDREALWAQRKAGSKRADNGVRQGSRSGEGSSTDRHQDRIRHRRVSSDSSSLTRRLSPPAKRSRLGGHHAARRSSSSEGREWSPRACLPRRSRSPLPRHQALHPHHHPITAGPGIVRLPLVGLSRLAGLGGLLDNRPCRHAGIHLHLSGGHDDHPGVASLLLHHGPGPPIVIPPYHPPGHLHPEDVGLVACPHAVSAPGLPAGIVSLDRTQLTNTSYASVFTMATNIHMILQSQNNQTKWMTLSCQLRGCKNCSQTFWTLLHFLTMLIHCRIVPRATSWYHMILLPLLLLLLCQDSM